MEGKIFKKLILLSFVLHVTFGRSLNQREGLNHSLSGEKRMINGVSASLSDWPFIVSLSYSADANMMWKVCSATLINRLWLVTAGHCVKNSAGAVIQPDQLKVKIRHNENSWEPEEFSVSEIHAKPESTDPTAFGFDNDIAIIKMAAFVPSNIETIGMYAGGGGLHDCKIAGWGSTQPLTNGVNMHNYEVSDTLKEIDVPIGVSWRDFATDFYHAYNASHTHDVFCAGQKTTNPSSAQGGCIGDSGSPLVCKRFSYKVLYGVLLGGSPSCTPGRKYMVFSDIKENRPWIASRMSV